MVDMALRKCNCLQTYVTNINKCWKNQLAQLVLDTFGNVLIIRYRNLGYIPFYKVLLCAYIKPFFCWQLVYVLQWVVLLLSLEIHF